MKAKIDNEPSFENAQKKLGCTMEKKIEFLLPYENSSRTLIKFKKDIITNKKYPRKFSEIKKFPL